MADNNQFVPSTLPPQQQQPVGTLPPGAFVPPTLPPSAMGFPSMGGMDKGMGKGFGPPMGMGMDKGYAKGMGKDFTMAYPPMVDPATGKGMGPPPGKGMGFPPDMGKGWMGKGMSPPEDAPTPPRQPLDNVPPPEEREVQEPDVASRTDVASRFGQDKDEEDQKKWHNIRQFTAYTFTLTAFTILAAPTIISIQLGMDVDASFWIGRWGLLALFVPVFLLGQHFYHMWMINNRKERRRYIFLIVPVFPAVLFMVIGGTYMSFSRNLYGKLKSSDCTPTGPAPDKFYMQEAYDEARAAYDQCLVRLRNDNMGQELRRHPNLQSCLEWDELTQNEVKGIVPWKGHKVAPGTLRQHNPSNAHRWQYLANVEINHICGGFCKPGPSLFVSYDHSGRQGGSCAQFVSFRFLSIMHWGTVVFTIGLLIVLLSIPTYVMSRGFLNSMGYKSAAVIA